MWGVEFFLKRKKDHNIDTALYTHMVFTNEERVLLV
jgi:hypothetical protein